MRREGERRLELHVPALEELWYREKLLGDPDTMHYNRGFDLSFSGYHRETGCIDFPRSRWESWYRYFIGQEPERWYAYILRRADGRFLGEVNVHRGGEAGCWDMGIVVEAAVRGQGLGREALGLLLDQAFRVLGIPALRNTFEDTREAARKLHLAAGFRETGRKDGLIELRLTGEEYLGGRIPEVSRETPPG